MEAITVGTMGELLLPPEGAQDKDPISGTHVLCGGSFSWHRISKSFAAILCSKCGARFVIYGEVNTLERLAALAVTWKHEQHMKLAEGRTTAWWQAVMEPYLAGDIAAAKRAILAFNTGLAPTDEELALMRQAHAHEAHDHHDAPPSHAEPEREARGRGHGFGGA
jgi:hypothetical protein